MRSTHRRQVSFEDDLNRIGIKDDENRKPDENVSVIYAELPRKFRPKTKPKPKLQEIVNGNKKHTQDTTTTAENPIFTAEHSAPSVIDKHSVPKIMVDDTTVKDEKALQGATNEDSAPSVVTEPAQRVVDENRVPEDVTDMYATPSVRKNWVKLFPGGKSKDSVEENSPRIPERKILKRASLRIKLKPALNSSTDSLDEPPPIIPPRKYRALNETDSATEEHSEQKKDAQSSTIKEYSPSVEEVRSENNKTLGIPMEDLLAKHYGKNKMAARHDGQEFSGSGHGSVDDLGKSYESLEENSVENPYEIVPGGEAFSDLSDDDLADQLDLSFGKRV